MSTVNKNKFWNSVRENRLIMWHERFKKDSNVYVKVANKLKTTKSSAYQKLGRMGKLEAAWAKKYH